MRKIVLALLLLPIVGWADGLVVSPLYELRSVRNETQDSHWVSSAGLGVGAGFSKNYLGLLEASSSQMESGDSSLSVVSQTTEVKAWLYRFQPTTVMKNYYAGVALGLSHTEVKTQLLNLTSNDQNGFESLAALAAGVNFRLSARISLGAEARISFSRDYDPNPQASILSRLIFQ